MSDRTGSRRLSPRAATAVGAMFGRRDYRPFFGVGLLIVLVAAGVIPAEEKSFHAPRWVVSACGLFFMVAGVALAADRARGRRPRGGAPRGGW